MAQSYLIKESLTNLQPLWGSYIGGAGSSRNTVHKKQLPNQYIFYLKSPQWHEMIIIIISSSIAHIQCSVRFIQLKVGVTEKMLLQGAFEDI